APQFALLAVDAVADRWKWRLEVDRPDVADVEQQRPPCRLARGDEVLDDLALAIDRDGASTRQPRHVDAMAGTAEGEVNALVTHALAREPVAHSHLVQQVDGALFEDAGSNALD